MESESEHRKYKDVRFLHMTLCICRKSIEMQNQYWRAAKMDGWVLKKLTWESWGKRPLLTLSGCQLQIDGGKSPKHSRK